MSRTDETIDERRGRTSPQQREIAGAIRRMELRVTDGASWQVVGHLLLDGKTRETAEADAFIGIGFYARPPAGANAEAIVAFVGGRQNPVIVGTRDEDTRREVAKDFPQDTTAMFNSQAMVTVDSDGKIRARLVGGAAVELAKASELNNLRAFVMQQFSGTPGHTHGVSGAATNTTVSVVIPVAAPVTAYPGTDILKGQ